ncbi:MAG: hypothetical protein GF347_03605 [Candidatus Moranbacteria bacterium]|nr:hypothetical protein [Candidatus Moranbacteria bacterium]
MKVNKLTKKRVKITKRKGKLRVFRKYSKQSHYNANDEGKLTRRKRKIAAVSGENAKRILTLT